jgi:hypothetical protein
LEKGVIEVAAAIPPPAEPEIRHYLVSFFRQRLAPAVEGILQHEAGFLEAEAAQESDPEGRKQPFLEAILPPRAIHVKRLERPFSTKLGKTLDKGGPDNRGAQPPRSRDRDGGGG